jgi:hypothetical protein
MNREEITAIVDLLFVGNKLARGEVTSYDGTIRVDLRNIRAPICVLCSWGDDITPPQLRPSRHSRPSLWLRRSDACTRCGRNAGRCPI